MAAAELRKDTHWRDKSQNTTIWSSTYNMLIRYDKIKDYIEELDIDVV